MLPCCWEFNENYAWGLLWWVGARCMGVNGAGLTGTQQPPGIIPRRRMLMRPLNSGVQCVKVLPRQPCVDFAWMRRLDEDSARQRSYNIIC